ncbi:YozE family protein [Metabacillus idriensis]|uniref:YozE family protein n=1 Tax=Metabacillus idriensis TaxID=324768 RepID=UPI00163AA031|nr:YozE family protein [Metabacillus idriensis]QNG58281.1 YozE family protein [Bacillus sp. PAMC26568]
MKSFYHYLMKYRHPKPADDISRFANDAYDDHSFPKSSDDYHDISSYLELNGSYLQSLVIFDEAWELYETEILKKTTI